ncbi:hypothetical protein VTP01DRAFT_742 [Rhizomucor pusillus]|uniref:uncharacterized protein n=1 Tax=Rhizomucor pusillus TaxID=4840 RepID=UPI003742E854
MPLVGSTLPDLGRTHWGTFAMHAQRKLTGVSPKTSPQKRSSKSLRAIPPLIWVRTSGVSTVVCLLASLEASFIPFRVGTVTITVKSFQLQSLDLRNRLDLDWK